MRYVFIVLGVFLWLIGLFLIILSTGTTQLLGLALIGTASFFGVLARIDQADVQHKALVAAMLDEPAPKSRVDRQMDELVERARQKPQTS